MKSIIGVFYLYVWRGLIWNIAEPSECEQSSFAASFKHTVIGAAVLLIKHVCISFHTRLINFCSWRGSRHSGLSNKWTWAALKINLQQLPLAFGWRTSLFAFVICMNISYRQSECVLSLTVNWKLHTMRFSDYLYFSPPYAARFGNQVYFLPHFHSHFSRSSLKVRSVYVYPWQFSLYFTDVCIYEWDPGDIFLWCCHIFTKWLLPRRLSNLLLSHTSPQSRRCAHFWPSGETVSASSFLKHADSLLVYYIVNSLFACFSLYFQWLESLKTPHMDWV